MKKKTLNGVLVLMLAVAVVFLSVSFAGCKKEEVAGSEEKEVVSEEEVKGEEATEKVELDEGPAKGGTLTFVLDYDVQRLNPINTTWMTDATRQIYQTLTFFEPSSGEVVPCLAESWEFSDDGLALTFKLKEGVTFHDGSPFNAEYVKWFLLNNRDSETNAWGSHYASISSVDVVDEYTVKLNLNNPDAHLLIGLATEYASCYSKEAFEKYGSDDYGTVTAVGTGPFMFKEWVPGDHLTLSRNDNYSSFPSFLPEEGPYLDEIIYRYISDATSRAIELESGNIDVATGINPIDIDRLEQNEDINIIEFPKFSIRYMAFNLESEIWGSDIQLRRAVWKALNRQEIVDGVLMGHGVSAFGYITEKMYGYWDGSKDAYPEDPEEAKAMLEEAGWVDTDDDGIREKDGKELVIVYYCDTETEYKQGAEMVQQQLANVGIKFEINAVDAQTHQAAAVSGDFDLIMMHWDWHDPEIAGLLAKSEWAGWPNASRINSEKSDKLFIDSQSAATLDERNQIFVELQKHLIEDICPWIPVYTPNAVYGINSRVHDYEPTADTRLYTLMNNVWVEE